MHTDFVHELPRARSFSDAEVVHDLKESKRRSWRSHDLKWLTGHGFADRIADLLQAGLDPARRAGMAGSAGSCWNAT